MGNVLIQPMNWLATLISSLLLTGIPNALPWGARTCIWRLRSMHLESQEHAFGVSGACIWSLKTMHMESQEHAYGRRTAYW